LDLTKIAFDDFTQLSWKKGRWRCQYEILYSPTI